MQISVNSSSDRRRAIEIFLLSVSVSFFIFRTAVPLFKYPFLFIFIPCLFYFPLIYREKIIIGLRGFIKAFWLVIILLMILVIAFLLSGKLYLTIFKDIVNALVLVITFFMISLSADTRVRFNNFADNLIDVFIFFGFAVSVAGILDLLAVFSVNRTLSIDNNFSLLPVYFGLGGSVYRLMKSNTRIKTAALNILIFFFIIQILMSGSRRGILVYSGITLFLAILQISSFIKYKWSAAGRTGTLAPATRILTLSLILLPALVILFAFESPYYLKENALLLAGTKDKDNAKYKISYQFYRYLSPFGKRFEFPVLYERIWSLPFDPAFPGSGWGDKDYSEIHTLPGGNSMIVPEGSRGLIIDSLKAEAMKGGKNIYLNRIIDRLLVKSGDIVEASVYCYVSPGFEGRNVGISIGGKGFDSLISAHYSFFKGDNGLSGKDHNLIENGDFSRGTDNWIANSSSTVHEIITTPFGKGIRVTRSEGDGDWSLQYMGRSVIYYPRHEYVFRFYYRVIEGEEVPFSIGWWLDDSGLGFTQTMSLPQEVNGTVDGWKDVSYRYRFREQHSYVNTFMNSLQHGSVVELAGIRLVDSDLDPSLPLFTDQSQGWWQKITARERCSGGRINISLFVGNDLPEGRNARGYVVFAHPEFKIVPAAREEMSGEGHSAGSDDNTPGNVDLQEKNSLIAGAPQALQKVGEEPLDEVSEPDLIRRIAAGFINQDTSYRSYRSDLNIDTLSNKFIGERYHRWKFAGEIFFKEYGLLRKVTGGGFDFLSWYSSYFKGDPTGIDYPHNPFLSVLLYSGLLGLMLYMLLLIRITTVYIMYRSGYMVFFIFFIITCFFTFFSGGSPFDPPAQGFFVILPLMISYVNERSAD